MGRSQPDKIEGDPREVRSTEEDQCEHKCPGKKESIKSIRGERLAVQSC